MCGTGGSRRKRGPPPAFRGVVELWRRTLRRLLHLRGRRDATTLDYNLVADAFVLSPNAFMNLEVMRGPLVLPRRR